MEIEMRSIQISTDVFAALWGRRVEGEDTEDEILRRILNVRTAPKDQPDNRNQQDEREGFTDQRYGVVFPYGFEIFRIYKGTPFLAQARNGKWHLEKTGKSYPSLNALSTAVGAKTENAWMGWFYLDKSNQRHSISKLRDDTKIPRRS